MLCAVENGVTLAERAQPGAKKTAILGTYGDGASGSSMSPCKRLPWNAARMPRWSRPVATFSINASNFTKMVPPKESIRRPCRPTNGFFTETVKRLH